jgi:hypothetical protein
MVLAIAASRPAPEHFPLFVSISQHYTATPFWLVNLGSVLNGLLWLNSPCIVVLAVVACWPAPTHILFCLDESVLHLHFSFVILVTHRLVTSELDLQSFMDGYCLCDWIHLLPSQTSCQQHSQCLRLCNLCLKLSAVEIWCMRNSILVKTIVLIYGPWIIHPQYSTWMQQG